MTSYELIILSTEKPFSHDDDDDDVDDVTKGKCDISSIRCGINLIRFICSRKILWVHRWIRHNVLLIKLNGEKCASLVLMFFCPCYALTDTLCILYEIIYWYYKGFALLYGWFCENRTESNCGLNNKWVYSILRFNKEKNDSLRRFMINTNTFIFTIF